MGSVWSYTQVIYMNGSYESEFTNPAPLSSASSYYYIDNPNINETLYDSFFGNGIDVDVNYMIIGAPGYSESHVFLYNFA